MTGKTHYTREEFFAELDALGEKTVRERYNTRQISDPVRRGLAESWLHDKAEARVNDERLCDRRIAKRANIIAISAMIMATALNIDEIISHSAHAINFLSSLMSKG